MQNSVPFYVMSKLFQLIPALFLAASVTGCASSQAYFADRGRDAADIVTVTVGKGVGVKARIGPFGLGLCINEDVAGLKSGQIFTANDHHDSDGELHLLLIGGESTELASLRNKDYWAFYLLGIPMPGTPFPFAPENKYPPYYFTQFDVAVGLGFTAKLGFNPGELLDFLLGWFGIDIYRDDMEARREEEKPSRP